MTTSSNDDGRDELDDPALRSMRAMWISMRDEEPPAAGLAELLAAARVKAEEMRPREPWWRRIAVALRRPPVLALATAVVLLGGAVVIGARREAFDAMPRIEGPPAGGGEAAPAKLEQAMAPAEDTAAGSAAPAPAEATGGGGVAGAPAVVAAATAGVSEDEPTAAPGGGATRPAPRPAFRAAAPRRGSAPPAAPAPEVAAPVAGTVTADRTVAADPPPITRERVEAEAAAAPVAAPAVVAPPAPPPPAAPPPPSVPRDVKGPKQRLQIADDGGSAGEAIVAAPDSSSAGGERIETTRRPAGPTVAQLAKQAETAAARGDCAAVRAIASRIRKLDAAAHRSLAERSAAVARCLK